MIFVQEMLDACQRFPDVIDAVGIRYADEAFSGFAKCCALHTGDLFFLQQQLAERVAAQPGLADIREDIECAMRKMAL